MTRSPSRNSAPCRAAPSARRSGAAAVDDDRAACRPSASARCPRRRPGQRRRSSPVGSSLGARALPPYLTTTTLPQKRGCRAAPRPGRRPGRTGRARASRRRPVLVDVAVAEVGGEDGRRSPSPGRGRSAARRPAPAMWARTRLVVVVGGHPAPAHHDAAVGDLDPVDVEGDARPSRARSRSGPSRGPRRRASTSPAGLGHLAGRPVGVVVGRGAPVTTDVDDLGRPLGVGRHLPARSPHASASASVRASTRRGGSPPGRWPARSRCRWWRCSRRRSAG